MAENNSEDIRRKYVDAWNNTMLDIWREQIVKLDVYDTGQLLNSLKALPVRDDGRMLEFAITQQFLEYGLWVDYGVGKEVFRGNGGDIGRDKVRKRKQWFSRKYVSSMMKMRDFIAESIGAEFAGVFASILKRR